MFLAPAGASPAGQNGAEGDGIPVRGNVVRYTAKYHPGQCAGINLSRMAPNRPWAPSPANLLSKPVNPFVMSAPTPNESMIGNTRYDLQTNGSMQNRLVLWDDMTLSATWTMGFSDPDFPDRGSGYNYYDGSQWGAAPAMRIDNVKTGWPAIAPWGAGGEIIVNHNLTNGLEILTRPVKGIGNWTETTFSGPPSCTKLSWPQVVTNGPNHQTIHLIYLTSPVSNGGTLYNGMDGALLYSRSQDGGQTWDLHHVQLPGTGFDQYVGLGGDTYAWAEPRGDTLALLVGDKWFDVFMLKSTDNGASWTKTIIFTHPFPRYEHNHTLIIDTIWVCDATMAVALDHNGDVNAFFGLMRVNNTDTTDEEYSYWPFTDGLVYWKEGEEPFSTLHVDSVYDRGNLVGWAQDVNGNDTVYGDMLDLPKYALSMTNWPTVTIDDQHDMYLIMSSEMEDHDNGTQNYKHLLARKFDHASGEWGDFFDLNDGLVHNFHECIFPAVARQSNAFIHYTYQADDEPGLAVRGDEDPYDDNMIYYAKVLKSDFTGIEGQETLIAGVGQNYPNPCHDKTNIVLILNRPARTRIVISDLNGRTVGVQDEGLLSQGRHLLDVDVQHLKPGVYCYTVTSGREKHSRRMIIY